ncbi:MAG TPA: dTMP kinase [Dehalococcoidia bacterium]|nr:dTMP kinase [Dehalococcoidia bacterium]
MTEQAPLPGLLPFISFEGGEGSGKSTQARLLAERLREHGREVVLTREPGGTPIGEQLRALARKPALARRFHRELTGGDWQRLDPLAELFLMEASRAQLVAELILPALARGAAVISDRFDDSTLAYQGGGRGLDVERLKLVNAVATRGLRPALTVLIDVPPEIGLQRKRAEQGRDAIGGETLAFHTRVREAYLRLAAAEPERWLVLDGTASLESLAAGVWERVSAVPALRVRAD